MDGHVLNVEFQGSSGGATGPCGVEYSVEAAYSEHAVVVIIHEATLRGDAGVPCLMSAVDRTASVTLREPIGNRVMLDVRDGRVIPAVRS
jgi:hypothetical protein